MSKPQKYTGYKIGDEGIIPSIILKYIKRHGLPAAWGDEGDQWQCAEFLVKIAIDPCHFEHLVQGVTNYDRQTYLDRMHQLYAAAPDEYLRFITFVRGKLHVVKLKDMTAAFLREGAVPRFKNRKKREPTDDELAQMFLEEQGISLASEHFGDARRQLCAEDQEVADHLSPRFTGAQ